MAKKKPAIVRTVEEVQHMHDLLHPLVCKEDGAPIIPDGSREKMHCSLVVLCWMLGHESGDEFQKNADELLEGLKKMGYNLAKPS